MWLTGDTSIPITVSLSAGEKFHLLRRKNCRQTQSQKTCVGTFISNLTKLFEYFENAIFFFSKRNKLKKTQTNFNFKDGSLFKVFGALFAFKVTKPQTESCTNHKLTKAFGNYFLIHEILLNGYIYIYIS